MRKILPSVLTLLNLVLGMAALLASAEGRYGTASMLVIGGVAADGLDGRLARAMKVESLFGRELDSLADMVTFGAAPSLVIYLSSLRPFGPAGAGAALAFAVAGALRLARYNTQGGAVNYFVGLPITAAGGILAVLSLSRGSLPGLWALALTFLLSLLMVSRTRYPNFKKIGFPRFSAVMVPLLGTGVALVSIFRRDALTPLLTAVLASLGGYGAWRVLRVQLRRVRQRRMRERREWHRS